MTHELPYTTAYGKIGQLFEKISKAKVPDAFTVKVLQQSLGMKSMNDRSLIPLLKKLGFLESSGKPTPDYTKLKNSNMAGRAIADGIKRAYAPLYESDENAHDLLPDELKGLIAQVSGAEDSLNTFIVGTFKNLVKAADFSAKPEAEAESLTKTDEEENKNNNKDNGDRRSAFNPDFKFNIEIHLPSNGTEETYLAIFNALRKSLG